MPYYDTCLVFNTLKTNNSLDIFPISILQTLNFTHIVDIQSLFNEFYVLQVEPPPPPPAEAAKEEGMETEKAGEESKASEDAPPQKQAEMDVD